MTGTSIHGGASGESDGSDHQNPAEKSPICHSEPAQTAIKNPGSAKETAVSPLLPSSVILFLTLEPPDNQNKTQSLELDCFPPAAVPCLSGSLTFLGARAERWLGILYSLCFHMTGKISHSLMLQRIGGGFVWAFPAMKTQTCKVIQRDRAAA